MRSPIRLRHVLASLTVLLSAVSAGAQVRTVPPARQAPPGKAWTVRTDAGGMAHDAGGDVKVEAMSRGWHVTTGPAAIVFDSTQRASGNWRLEAVLHLFDPGARAEGFGVIFGGAGLMTANQRYSYALVRRDGRALMKVRDGATTRTVRDWAANARIPQWRAGPPGTSVKYQIVIEATATRVKMSVGGADVLDAPRSELLTDGVIGLRINHALSVHVESLTVAALPAR
jgi:hypothetical protein